MYIDLKAKLVFLQTFLLMNYFFKHKKEDPKLEIRLAICIKLIREYPEVKLLNSNTLPCPFM